MDALPLHILAQRVGPGIREMIRSEMLRMQKGSAICPSYSSYSLFIVLVKKYDTGIHFCTILEI